MASAQVGDVWREVRRLLGGPDAEPWTDRQLLDRFARHHDQGAFAALVGRHGAMVLGVCAGVLGDAHDAEDAFQATFLVLAKKAGAVRWSDTVGGWLHQVAYRVACKARARGRRRRQERPMNHAEPADLSDPGADPELAALLQAELAALPEKYRSPLVLCYLEGKTHAEAATLLGCPQGSMSKRLAQGQRRLRERLARQGVAVSATALAAAVGQAAAAAVPEALRQSTTQAAALLAAGNGALSGVASAPVTALVEGALRDMFLRSVKMFALVGLAVAALATGAGAWVYSVAAADRPAAKDLEVRAAVRAPAPAAAEPWTPQRTFKSALPLQVFQYVPGGVDKHLGMTGPGTTKAVVVPAGAVWYVQPVPTGGWGFGGGALGQLGNLGGQFGLAGGGAVNLGGQLGVGGGGLNLGGMRGMPAGVKPPAPGKAPVAFGLKLTGAPLKQLVADMKKQSVPGLCVDGLAFTDDDLAELKGLTGLRTLLLRRVAVGDGGMKQLTKLPNLRHLGLEATAVTDAGLKSVAEHKGLRSLRLAGAKLGDAGIGHLRSHKALTSLRLHGTGVTGAGLKLLKSLTTLETLELSGVFLDKDMKDFKDLESVKTLRLYQTEVGDAGMEHLAALKGLKALTVDPYFGLQRPTYGGGGAGGFCLIGAMPGGGVGGIGGGALGGAMAGFQIGGFAAVKPAVFLPKQAVTPEGKVVKLEPAPLTGKGLKHLAALKGLVELNVVSEKLADDDLEALGKLGSLKTLRLVAPEVTDAGLGALKDLKLLEELDLRGTQLSAAGAAKLKPLARLKALYTNLQPHDPQYKKQLAEFKKALPRVAVHPLYPAPPRLGGTP